MAPDARKPLVLVVEDHPVNMKLATELLRRHGFEVLEAIDGASALQLATQQSPELILLDLHLPGMDGFELFRRLRQLPALRQVKIVALTASALREEEEQIRAFGFDDYISKPIDTKRFIEQVRQLTNLEMR